MSAAEHLREAIDVGCTRDDHDHVADHRAEVISEVADWILEHPHPGDDPAEFYAGLVRRMADAGQVGKDTREGESTQTADFFQPGHTYTRQHHGDRIEFYVEHIASAPSGRLRIAFGWRTGPDGAEEPSDSDDLDGWTDVTEAGEGR